MSILLFIGLTEGIFIERSIIDGKVCERFVIRSEGLSKDLPVRDIPKPKGSDTTILWVDRNHQHAIVRTVAIGSDGMHINSNWHLNNERISAYRTLGSGLPLWSYSGGFPWFYGGHNCGADTHHLTFGNGDGTFFWDFKSSYPVWIFPRSARATIISRDGKRVATADQNGNLYLLNESGDIMWSANFSEGNRLQGLDISFNGSVVVVTVYDSCFIFENGIIRDRLPIGTTNTGTQYAARISEDGRYLVTGDYYGRLKLYRWNGSGYDLVWTAQVGNPWITDVGISADGSTVVCGTGYTNGKVCLFDSSSSTPLWQFQGYGGYGALIASVDLSDHGERIAVASWGDTAHVGDFYVFTLHDRNSPNPIIGISRNDEPGSLFAVSISGNGEYVATGGKAVHALEMGSGGEVYAILCGSYYDRNVGAVEIKSPGRLLKVGNIIDPKATYTNYGDSIEDFFGYFEIIDSTGQEIYLDSNLITRLEPDSIRELVFKTWTVPDFGFYDLYAYTKMAQDQYPGDDTVKKRSIAYHNGAVVSVKPPFGEHTINYRFNPIITVKNSGSYNDTIFGIVSIIDSSGGEIYRDSGFVYLVPDQSASISLSDFRVPYVGPFNCIGLSWTNGDYIKEDDSLSFPFSGSYEIIYDDGDPDAYYWVGANDNNKFAIRFSPLINQPYFLTGARVYVNRIDPFDYVQLCPDASGLPDTANPILTANNVSAQEAPDWAIIPFDTIALPSGDLWIVLHWPQNSPPLCVGADNAKPLDLRSWWYSNTNGWNQWTSHDWMVRMKVEPEVQIVEKDLFQNRIGVFFPNPFTKSGVIPFAVKGPTRVKATVYDPIGREVRVLVDRIFGPGIHKIIWDGKDGIGSDRCGVFYIRFEVGEKRMTFKVVKIRNR
ncbi:MAG TPA: WD40 repeat domain-containing protein [bacterium (Candidatus Stahlbacteria)]|nr:WD40 repeat domain-containing protein [Candidatus Stahlbacteria bacterium]